MRSALRAQMTGAVAVALGLAALAGAVLPAGASATGAKAPKTRLCPAVKAKGITYGLAISRGSVSCTDASRTMSSFLAGGGREHGGRSAPEASKYWTLSGGWTCTHATNGGNCFRGGGSYLSAREVIGTYSLTAKKRHAK